MTSLNLNYYNTKIYDFEWFFLTFQKTLLDELYDLKLLSDRDLKNIDTKKVFHKIAIEHILSRLHETPEKVIFLIKPEIISAHSEIFQYFDDRKIRKEFMTLFKFLRKNKFNVFIFLKKSFVVMEHTLDINSPDIRDFLDIHILKTDKKLFSKVPTRNSLTKKMFKVIR